MSDLFEGRVFNSAEEINQRFGVELKLPEDIPEGCNLLCYKILDLYDIKLFLFYKEDGLLYTYNIVHGWGVCNRDLKSEIREDESYLLKYIYLRLSKEETEKEVFKPERLLGVETNQGFVVDVFGGDWTDKLPTLCFGFQTTKGYCYSNHSDFIKYYISDDSDETVSFEEYLDMFYIRG